MRFDVLSLFPELIEQYCTASIMGIAQSKKLYELHTWNPRDYSKDKHKRVDDTPYGGGAGMLLSPQPFGDCLDAVLEKANSNPEILITSPSGEVWNQELARDLSHQQQIIILCGRYEGFDQRIRNRATREISIGDYVLSGGELPALITIDSILRNLPGVLGDPNSVEFESFNEFSLIDLLQSFNCSRKEIANFLSRVNLDIEANQKIKLLEFPQYTRPANYEGLEVPPVLESGDHKAIALWRLEEAIKLTKAKRPDLIK